MFSAAILAIGTLTLVHAGVIGADYYYTFRPAGARFLASLESPYEEPNGFYNAPWAVPLVVPFSVLPPEEGQALLDLVSLACIASAVIVIQRIIQAPSLFEILVIINLQVLDLLVRGQLDGLVLLGITLGYWAVRNRRPFMLSIACWLMLIKPQNVILPALLLLYACRDWSRREWLQILSLPALAFLGAEIILGYDWPVRYIAHLQTNPPYSFPLTTLWRALDELGMTPIPFLAAMGLVLVVLGYFAVHKASDDRLYPLALASNLTFTPYALDYHYILLAPVFLFVARRNWRLALFAYLLTWAPLLRLSGSWRLVWVDVAYPLLLFVLTFVHSVSRSSNSS